MGAVTPAASAIPPQGWSEDAWENERRALHAVLISRTFSRTPRLAALLEYVCAQYFQGSGDSLREYNIAMDVFHRGVSFDQSTDAIVRVEVHRLRKKLKEFYADEGASESLQVVIQSGQYLPAFHRSSSDAEEDSNPLLTVPAAAAQTAAQNNTTAVALAAPLNAPVAAPHVPQIDSGSPAPTARGPRSRWLLSAALSLLVCASVLAWGVVRLTPANRSNTTPPPILPASLNRSAHILCGRTGAAWRDRMGIAWEPDRYFTGGTAVQSPASPVYRTSEPALFRAMRMGDFSYAIPMPPGTYEARLYLADFSYAPGPAMDGGEGLRLFDVSLNGVQIFHKLDIIADAGPNTADIKVIDDIHPAADGFIHFTFSRALDAPLLNALEILPATPHRANPVRILAQSSTVTDRAGVIWSPDNYFLGGRTNAVSGTALGSDDPELFARERYGNFSYAIPVPPGAYAVRLHFLEAYWGPQSPGGGGLGSRVFDVYCNGIALLRDFDLFREAGPHRAFEKTFHGVRPNAQGKLLLSFVPRNNYATLSAIEVLDEAPSE